MLVCSYTKHTHTLSSAGSMMGAADALIYLATSSGMKHFFTSVQFRIGQNRMLSQRLKAKSITNGTGKGIGIGIGIGIGKGNSIDNGKAKASTIAHYDGDALDGEDGDSASEGSGRMRALTAMTVWFVVVVVSGVVVCCCCCFSVWRLKTPVSMPNANANANANEHANTNAHVNTNATATATANANVNVHANRRRRMRRPSNLTTLQPQEPPKWYA